MAAVKVLVIDDDQWTRQAVQEILTRAGYTVLALTSGDGLDELLNREEFSLALIDYHLPWRNGLELARLLKQRLPAVRIVLISSAFRSNQELGDQGAVIDRFLSKPFSKTMLLNLLAELQPGPQA